VTIGSIYKEEYAGARNEGERLGSNFVPRPKILVGMYLDVIEGYVPGFHFLGYGVPGGVYRLLKESYRRLRDSKQLSLTFRAGSLMLKRCWDEAPMPKGNWRKRKNNSKEPSPVSTRSTIEEMWPMH
jgi:hypothetical protein